MLIPVFLEPSPHMPNGLMATERTIPHVITPFEAGATRSGVIMVVVPTSLLIGVPSNLSGGGVTFLPCDWELA